PGSAETGAERGSSRPGLPKPVPLSGATEPVFARPGRQECRMRPVLCFVGIDVAKAQLDIALRPSGERWAVPNDARGVATLVDRLQVLPPTLIVLEATGGLERLVTGVLATAGLPVV